MDDTTRANQAIWDAWTAGEDESDHAKDAAKVLAGGSSLRGIERAEVGEVAGKTLLHLLCNRGSDTLSWARLGATVTGVDFSAEAIARARQLAQATGLPACFIHSDLYALPDVLDGQFDLVYASYGVLCWMPDLARWARIAAHYVRPGGVFYLVEMHPFASFLARDASAPPPGLRLRLDGAYFHSTAPELDVVRVPTDDGEGSRPATLHTWSYSLGEVVSALIGAGLRIEFLREHAASFYQQYPTLVPGDDGLWRWPDPATNLPLLFSLRAIR